jgi:hypothetical protein
VDYALECDPDHRLVLITMGRIVTERSALAALAAVEQFMVTHGPHSVIADLSAIEKLCVRADFVWYIAARSPAIPDGMARIVAASRPDVYGLSRMFQTLRDNRGAYQDVVRTLEEAFKLLNLESPHFRPVVLSGSRGKIAA